MRHMSDLFQNDSWNMMMHDEAWWNMMEHDGRWWNVMEHDDTWTTRFLSMTGPRSPISHLKNGGNAAIIMKNATRHLRWRVHFAISEPNVVNLKHPKTINRPHFARNTGSNERLWLLSLNTLCEQWDEKHDSSNSQLLITFGTIWIYLVHLGTI